MVAVTISITSAADGFATCGTQQHEACAGYRDILVIMRRKNTTR